MAQDNRLSMPGTFGGLMRYDEEFSSRFMLTPTQVIIFVASIIVGVVAFTLFFPLG